MDARSEWMRGAAAAGLAVALALALGLAGGCAQKAKTGDAKTEDAKTKAWREQRAKDLYAKEKWMREGQYVPVTPELRQKITQALDKFEALTSYRLGLYSQDGPVLTSIDGEFGGGNAHLVVQKTGQEYPWECFLIDDRFFAQEGSGLTDHGPNSRQQAERMYRPMYKEVRVAISQAMNGEVKDAGPMEYQKQPVRRYDFRVRVPVEGPNLLTATVDLDENLGLIRHVAVGQGTGSEASSQRFITLYRECQFERFGEEDPVRLPEGVKIKAFESQKDALENTLGLE
jgi:hypothetical protein